MEAGRAVEQFVRNSAQVSVTIDGEEVILTLDDGVYYALNSTARVVWAALEAPRCVEELCAALCEDFDVSTDEARPAVITLLGDLERFGLVIRSLSSP